MRSIIHRRLVAISAFALFTALSCGTAGAMVDPSPNFRRIPMPDQFTALREGSRGIEVYNVRKRLMRLGFPSGDLSVTYDPALRMTVWAFQKANGLRPVNRIDPPTWRALLHPRPIRPLVRNGESERTEIDLRRQLLTVWSGGRPVLVSHISTGAGRSYCVRGHCGFAETPVGDFRAGQRAPGWSTGILGSMFHPVYFNGGIAVHGSTLVPRYPASHGCVRVPLHNAVALYRLLRPGHPVHVRRSPLHDEHRPATGRERNPRTPDGRRDASRDTSRDTGPALRPAPGRNATPGRNVPRNAASGRDPLRDATPGPDVPRNAPVG
ncbi:L,D-transpeptidase family protein [Streptosporangium sp. DT93]|uniref:L,D-transpeptidase family protein n=1 Tax=Streptosporangium sp. DT93 TaxID=3393428 RepID=UPI003CEBA3FD